MKKTVKGNEGEGRAVRMSRRTVATLWWCHFRCTCCPFTFPPPFQQQSPPTAVATSFFFSFSCSSSLLSSFHLLRYSYFSLFIRPFLFLCTSSGLSVRHLVCYNFSFIFICRIHVLIALVLLLRLLLFLCSLLLLVLLPSHSPIIPNILTAETLRLKSVTALIKRSNIKFL